MPVIPTYTADVGQGRSLSGRRASAADFGGLEGEALEGFGTSLGKAATTIETGNEQRDILGAYKEAALAREQLRTRLDELRQSGEPIGEDSEIYMEEVLGDLISNRTTARGRALAEQSASILRSNAQHEAITYDASLVGEEAKETASTMIEVNGNELQSNPDILQNVILEQESFVDNLAVPKQVKTALLREMNEHAAKNAVIGWIDLDPEGAKEMVKKGQFDEYLTADNRAALIGRADQIIRARDTEKRLERAETDRLKSIETNKAMNQALIDIFSEGEDKLTTGGIAALALQTFPDGDPIFDSSQINVLYNILERAASEGAIKTDPSVAMDIIPRLDTITPEEVTEIMGKGGMAIHDYERWHAAATEGQSALKSIRSVALRGIPGLMDIPPQLSSMIPGFADANIQIETLAREREQKYRDDGKNPVDYYSSGEYEKDVRMVGRELKLISAGRELRDALNGIEIGDVVNGYRYKGGDVNDVLGSWEPVEPDEDVIVEPEKESKTLMENINQKTKGIIEQQTQNEIVSLTTQVYQNAKDLGTIDHFKKVNQYVPTVPNFFRNTGVQQSVEVGLAKFTQFTINDLVPAMIVMDRVKGQTPGFALKFVLRKILEEQERAKADIQAVALDG